MTLPLHYLKVVVITRQCSLNQCHLSRRSALFSTHLIHSSHVQSICCCHLHIENDNRRLIHDIEQDRTTEMAQLSFVTWLRQSADLTLTNGRTCTFVVQTYHLCKKGHALLFSYYATMTNPNFSFTCHTNQL